LNENIYFFELHVDDLWKDGRIEAKTIENAAIKIKQRFKLANKECTIILYPIE